VNFWLIGEIVIVSSAYTWINLEDKTKV